MAQTRSFGPTSLSNSRVVGVVLRRVVRAEGRTLPLDVGRHARPHDRHPVQVADGRPPRSAVRIAGRRHLRDEAVTEGAVAEVQHLARVVLPAGPVDRVARVDVDEAPIRVAPAGRRRPRPEDRRVRVGQPPEEPLPLATVRPVRRHLERRDRTGPVRQMELHHRLTRFPRVEAAHGQQPLPRLDRPVRPVRRRARHDQKRQRRPVVRAAPIGELGPHGSSTRLPAAAVVTAKGRLRRLRSRPEGVDRSPHEHVSPLAPCGVRDEGGGPVDLERQIRGIDGEDLRGRSRRSEDQRGGDYHEQSQVGKKRSAPRRPVGRLECANRGTKSAHTGDEITATVTPGTPGCPWGRLGAFSPEGSRPRSLS